MTQVQTIITPAIAISNTELSEGCSTTTMTISWTHGLNFATFGSVWSVCSTCIVRLHESWSSLLLLLTHVHTPFRQSWPLRDCARHANVSSGLVSCSPWQIPSTKYEVFEHTSVYVFAMMTDATSGGGGGGVASGMLGIVDVVCIGIVDVFCMRAVVVNVA